MAYCGELSAFLAARGARGVPRGRGGFLDFPIIFVCLTNGWNSFNNQCLFNEFLKAVERFHLCLTESRFRLNDFVQRNWDSFERIVSFKEMILFNELIHLKRLIFVQRNC